MKLAIGIIIGALIIAIAIFSQQNNTSLAPAPGTGGSTLHFCMDLDANEVTTANTAVQLNIGGTNKLSWDATTKTYDFDSEQVGSLVLSDQSFSTDSKGRNKIGIQMLDPEGNPTGTFDLIIFPDIAYGTPQPTTIGVKDPEPKTPPTPTVLSHAEAIPTGSNGNKGPVTGFPASSTAPVESKEGICAYDNTKGWTSNSKGEPDTIVLGFKNSEGRVMKMSQPEQQMTSPNGQITTRVEDNQLEIDVKDDASFPW